MRWWLNEWMTTITDDRVWSSVTGDRLRNGKGVGHREMRRKCPNGIVINIQVGISNGIVGGSQQINKLRNSSRSEKRQYSSYRRSIQRDNKWTWITADNEKRLHKDFRLHTSREIDQCPLSPFTIKCKNNYYLWYCWQLTQMKGAL